MEQRKEVPLPYVSGEQGTRVSDWHDLLSWSTNHSKEFTLFTEAGAVTVGKALSFKVDDCVRPVQADRMPHVWNGAPHFKVRFSRNAYGYYFAMVVPAEKWKKSDYKRLTLHKPLKRLG